MILGSFQLVHFARLTVNSCDDKFTEPMKTEHQEKYSINDLFSLIEDTKTPIKIQ